MSANLAWIVNPRRRRRKAKRSGARRGRSAAQRAATARMLAANRGRRRGRARSSYAANPRPRRRSRGRSIARSFRRARRSFSASMPGAVGMLKNAAVAGGGAVTVDIAMGYLGRAWDGAASPMNADGTTNWLYFAAKTGLAVGLGTYGRRVLPGAIAQRMGEGALTVLAYQIIRGFVPSGVALGYLNPAPTQRALAGSGRGGQSLGKYFNLSGSNTGGSSLGAYESSGERSAVRASNIVRMAR